MSNGWRTLEGIPIDDIYVAIREEANRVESEGGDLVAYIGTDGQNIGREFTSFVQVVALHNIRESGSGGGGRVFFVRHLERGSRQRTDRLLREADLSIKLAQKMAPLFEELDIVFEVHADVNSNPKWASHSVHDTVKGWIQSMGFECKTKPHAFVASIVADKHTRKVKFSKNRPKIKKRKGML